MPKAPLRSPLDQLTGNHVEIKRCVVEGVVHWWRDWWYPGILAHDERQTERKFDTLCRWELSRQPYPVKLDVTCLACMAMWLSRPNWFIEAPCSSE